MKLSEIQSDKRILIIGGSGTGKTTLIGTLCQLVPTLVITADANGLDTLRSMGIDTEIILLEDWGHVWSYYTEIAKLANTYAAIAIDDLGAVQETSQDRIELSPRHAGEEKQRDRDKVAFQTQLKEQIMLGERRLQIQQWGELYLAVSNFVSEILRLPYRVKLVTCLETIKSSPRDGADHIYPAIAGQIAYTLPAKFSMVAETFIANIDGANHYTLTCKTHPRVETKTRYDTTGGRTWVNPSLQKVLKYINSEGEPETNLEKKIGIGL